MDKKAILPSKIQLMYTHSHDHLQNAYIIINMKHRSHKQTLGRDGANWLIPGQDARQPF